MAVVGTAHTLALRLPALAFRAAIALLARSLSPDACAACDATVIANAVFCPSCAATVLRTHVGDRHGRLAFAEFGEAIARAIRRLKYANRPDLARPLGELLRRAAREASLEADLVVPVPLHPRRLAERGYNQAALLAQPLARELGARLLPRALVRTRNTPHQAALERAARLANVARAFEPRAPALLRGRSVVLVDDVATTGATLDACIRAIEGAGAASVTPIVVAVRRFG